MRKKYGVSIFLPIYNEEKILAEHTLLIYRAARKLQRPFEIVIVDDTSYDSTYEIAKKLSKKYKEIALVRFENGPSRRENLSVALKRAKYPILLYTDVDLSVGLSYLPELIQKIDDGYDVATGSRYMGVKPKREFYRKVLSKIYNWFIRIFLGSKIKDHQCGFKAMKKEAFDKLAKELGYDKTFIRGWFWDAEFLIRAQNKGYKISEFPVTWYAGKQSSFSIRRELRSVYYIIRFILNGGLHNKD